MSLLSGKPGPTPGSRSWSYSDPRICPACGYRAEIVVGARRYCRACATAFENFIRRIVEQKQEDDEALL